MPSPLLFQGVEELTKKWGWLVALGLLMIIGGAFAIGHSVLATAVMVIFFGWLLVFAGVMEAISAFYVQNWSCFFLNLLGAMLHLVVGALMLARPLEGAAILTLLLAVFFVVGGVFSLVAAFQSKHPAWGWMAFNGVVTTALGVMLWMQWPYSGLWFLGFCLGLELIFRGWAWVMIGFAVRGAGKRLAAT